MTWTYDIANRISTAGGTPPAGATKSYAISVQYASQGDISSFTLGNGLVEARTYDIYRQQPTGVTLGVNVNDSSKLGLSFAYCAGTPPCTNNNGNLQSQTIGLLGATQTYTYDTLNRLNVSTEKTGATTNWSETFNYDNFGNRWVFAHSGITLSGLTPIVNYYNSATNRFQSTDTNFSYDNNGNQTLVSPYGISYDAENRQTGIAINGNTTATYTYDGGGRRVTKAITGGAITTYVYDVMGNLAAEYSTAPPLMPCFTCYLTVDHLGSTRLVTDQNGSVVSRHDFLPFGEELSTSNRTSSLGYGVTDNVMHKYTGKERDIETGLDFFHARYFHGPQGRFTSPDPLTAASSISNPQRWNAYAYVHNGPLSWVDPSGLQSRPATVIVDGVVVDHFTALGSNALSVCPNNVCSFQGPNGLVRFRGDTSGGSYVEASAVQVTVFGQTYSYHNVTVAGTLDPFGIELHHNIPQEFGPFMPPGIDIEDYTMLLPRWLHRLSPFGLHTKAFDWNGQWRAMMEENRYQPTLLQVKQFAGAMSDRLTQYFSTVTQVLGQAYEEVEPVVQEALEEIPPP